MESNLGKKLVQAAITVAVVAFILSFSRMFLTVAERASEGADLYLYDLSQNGTLSAFIAVALISIVVIIVGVFISKSLAIISTPLIAGGAITLIYTSVGSYLLQSLSHNGTSSHGFVQSNIVLFLVFAFELAALIAYAEFKLPNEETISEPSPTSGSEAGAK